MTRLPSLGSCWAPAPVGVVRPCVRRPPLAAGRDPRRESPRPLLDPDLQERRRASSPCDSRGVHGHLC